MEQRRHSPPSEAPEAIPQSRTTFGYIGSDYEYYEPPPTAFDRQRSPVPEYQQYETSPRVSAGSPPPPSSDLGRSPQLSDSGFSKSRPLSPSVQYSEIHSPDPQMVDQDPQGEKEAVYSAQQHHSKVPSYYPGPVPGITHQDSGDRPQVWSGAHNQHHLQHSERKRPFYKRWWFFLLLILLIIVIAVAVACGVVFGTKKHNQSNGGGSSSSSGHPGTNTNADPDTSIGGQINSAYYSKSGAWNGTGIAIAAANTLYNQAIYTFYQDYNGAIQNTLYDPSGSWHPLGPVHNDKYKPLNGTPLSAVQHLIGSEIKWHVFYIDQNYIIRERILSNVTTAADGINPLWTDGPLSSQNLKTWQSNSIGMQACYWGNYYGQWSYNATQASAGIHLWFASDATVFQQYSWTNGTNTYTFDRQWNDLSGNAGVGCQTWLTGQTEYVWFVDTQNTISMWWKDNNRSAPATGSHPIGVWTGPIPLNIKNVQKDSSLGYTNYMVWQDQDTTIRGAGILWGAENTTVNSTAGIADTFTIQTNNKDVHAIRGTHISFTAVTTGSGGHQLQAFFQTTGNDVSMFTRDAYTPGSLFQAASADPVPPS